MLDLLAEAEPGLIAVPAPRAGSLHVGPAHVIEYVNERFRERNPGRDVLGMPAREAFPEPRFAPIQALMDEVYRTGACLRARTPDGRFSILPRPAADGSVRGIAVLFEPPPPRARRPRARPRLVA